MTVRIFLAMAFIAFTQSAQASAIRVDFGFFIASCCTAVNNVMEIDIQNSSTGPQWDLIEFSILTAAPQVGLGLFEDQPHVTFASTGTLTFGPTEALSPTHTRELTWTGALAPGNSANILVDADEITDMSSDPWVYITPAGSFVGATVTALFEDDDGNRQTLNARLGDNFASLPISGSGNNGEDGSGALTSIPAPPLGGLAIILTSMLAVRRQSQRI